MINHRKTPILLTVIAFAVGWPIIEAHAQGTAAGDSTTAPPANVLPDVPAGEAGAPPSQPADEAADDATTPAVQLPPPPVSAPLVFPSVSSEIMLRRRVKPLQVTAGLDPTAPDFGGEADLISTADDGTANVKPARWTFVAHGFLRAPLRIGIGPSVDMASSNELHSPAHVVGATNTDWNFVGLNPSPTGSLYLSVGNAVVSGTLILSSGTFFDSGYRQLNQMGGISQGYLTMKFKDVFGSYGGLALTAGAFSNRYGMAGPHQNSSGYYNTALFGRTHVAGAALTGDYDLTEHLEAVVEVGGGSKIEVVPWLNPPLATPYVPDQGPTPQGSNFVGHIHGSLLADDWLRVGAHFMASYTPNDLQASTGGPGGQISPPRSGHIYTSGLEAHLDLPRFGSGYIGYSYLSAVRVLALADGIEVLHSSNGVGLVRNYLNPKFMFTPGMASISPGNMGDSGQIQTVLFQYMIRMAPLLQLPANGRDLTIAVFGMFNHVTAPLLDGGGTQDKFKFGAEAEFAAIRYLSFGFRFDRVMPNGGKAEFAYTAISPRVIFHSSWLSREYLILNYTRYMLGSSPQFVTTQYDPITFVPDKNLLVLSALISF